MARTDDARERQTRVCISAGEQSADAVLIDVFPLHWIVEVASEVAVGPGAHAHGVPRRAKDHEQPASEHQHPSACCVGIPRARRTYRETAKLVGESAVRLACWHSSCSAEARARSVAVGCLLACVHTLARDRLVASSCVRLLAQTPIRPPMLAWRYRIGVAPKTVAHISKVIMRACERPSE